MANKLTQLRDIMGADAFSEYLLTQDGIAHAVTLLAGIDDENLGGSLGEVVDEEQLEAIEEAIETAPEVEGSFPAPIITYPSSQNIKRSANATLKLRGGYFTKDTEIKCEGLEVLSYRFYYSRYIYVYVKGGTTKGYYPLTVTNSQGETTVENLIKIT